MHRAEPFVDNLLQMGNWCGVRVDRDSHYKVGRECAHHDGIYVSTYSARERLVKRGKCVDNGHDKVRTSAVPVNWNLNQVKDVDLLLVSFCRGTIFLWLHSLSTMEICGSRAMSQDTESCQKMRALRRIP